MIKQDTWVKVRNFQTPELHEFKYLSWQDTIKINTFMFEWLILYFDNLKTNQRSYYKHPNLAFWGWLSFSLESQPQNPEFRINPENFHPWRQQQLSLLCRNLSYLTLSKPVMTYVLCSSRLFKFLGSLYCKKYVPRSACFLGIMKTRFAYLFHQNICCDYSKEPSQWDLCTLNMFKLMNRKIVTIVYAKNPIKTEMVSAII